MHLTAYGFERPIYIELAVFEKNQQSQMLIKRSINPHCSHTYCENNMTLAFVKCTEAEAVSMRRLRTLMSVNSGVEI